MEITIDGKKYKLIRDCTIGVLFCLLLTVTILILNEKDASVLMFCVSTSVVLILTFVYKLKHSPIMVKIINDRIELYFTNIFGATRQYNINLCDVKGLLENYRNGKINNIIIIYSDKIKLKKKRLFLIYLVSPSEAVSEFKSKLNLYYNK